MAINLLIGAGASITGPWTRIEPAKSVDYPIRLVFVSHSWAGDNVVLEELVGGLPGTGNTPYIPRNDTGTVLEIQTVAPGSGDVVINAPIDYIRARTASGVTGTVDVFLTMNA